MKNDSFVQGNNPCNIHRPSNKKRVTGYLKKPHTSIFIGQTSCGKTQLVLELIEKEYNKHFDYIVISVQHSEKVIQPIMLRSGSKTIIKFGL